MNQNPPPLPQSEPQPVLAYATPMSQPTGLAAWRRGTLLLTSRNVQLPPSCVKCNRPEVKRYRKDVYWHEPLLYLTILAGLLVYLIVALIVRKKATYTCGLCEEHAKARSTHVLVIWLILALGLVGFVVGIAGVAEAFGRNMEHVFGWFIPLGILMMIGSGIYAAITMPLLKPKKVDDHYAHYAGCGDEFLGKFPEA